MWLKVNDSEAIHKNVIEKFPKSALCIHRFVLRLFYIYSIDDKLESIFVVVVQN